MPGQDHVDERHLNEDPGEREVHRVLRHVRHLVVLLVGHDDAERLRRLHLLLEHGALSDLGA